MKVARQRADEELEKHLHSNMDRFERKIVDNICGLCDDLHSNMDRFESISRMQNILIFTEIYIPIWIDLKGGV